MLIKKLYNDTIEVQFQDSVHRYKVDGKYVPGVSSVLNVLHKDLVDWAAWMAAENLKEALTAVATSTNKITKVELKKLADIAKKAHRAKSQRGKDVGTIVHEWIKEETDKKQPVEVPQYVQSLLDELANFPEGDEEKMATLEADLKTVTDNFKKAEHCVRQWRQWMIDYDIEIIKSEFIVHSKKLGYCGTADLVFRSRRTGKVFIGDYKTSEPQKIKNSKFMVVGHRPYPEHFVQTAAYDYAHGEEYDVIPDGYAIIYLPKEGNYQMFTREHVKQDREHWEHLYRVYEWITAIKKEK